jgi:hypothetical protein
MRHTWTEQGGFALGMLTIDVIQEAFPARFHGTMCALDRKAPSQGTCSP